MSRSALRFHNLYTVKQQNPAVFLHLYEGVEIVKHGIQQLKLSVVQMHKKKTALCGFCHNSDQQKSGITKLICFSISSNLGDLHWLYQMLHLRLRVPQSPSGGGV